MITNMETTKEVNGSVHLLLCGHSTDHLIRVIEAYNPAHIDFFTSLNLRSHLEEFIETLGNYSGTYHIEDIPAFTDDSIRVGSYTIISRYLILKKLFPSRSFYFGITGGTNTMAVEMALAALTAGEAMHYVTYGTGQEPKQDRIITFNILELRERIFNGDIKGGEIDVNR